MADDLTKQLPTRKRWPTIKLLPLTTKNRLKIQTNPDPVARGVNETPTVLLAVRSMLT